MGKKNQNPAYGYELGQWVGEVKARLDAHDQDFSDLNIALSSLGGEMKGMRSEVQRLADQAVADAEQRIKTAEAVKEVANRRMEPITRFLAISTTVLAFAMIVVVAYFSAKHG